MQLIRASRATHRTQGPPYLGKKKNVEGGSFNANEASLAIIRTLPEGGCARRNRPAPGAKLVIGHIQMECSACSVGKLRIAQAGTFWKGVQREARKRKAQRANRTKRKERIARHWKDRRAVRKVIGYEGGKRPV